MKSFGIFRNTYGKLITLVIAGCYLTILAGIPMHTMIHQAEIVEDCSNQLSTCHLNIVHGSEQGCDHKAHLFEAELDVCELCAINHNAKFEVLQRKTIYTTLTPRNSYYSNPHESWNYVFKSSNNDRGPPQLS